MDIRWSRWPAIWLAPLLQFSTSIQALGQTPGEVLRVLVQASPTSDPPFELAITNLSQKAVSGFRYRLELEPDDANAGVITEDLVTSFLAQGKSVPGRYAQVGPLMPGQTLYRPYLPAEAARDRIPIGLATAVVFTDNTGVGEEGLVQSFFDFRSGMAAGLDRALEQLRSPIESNEDLRIARGRLLFERQALGSRKTTVQQGHAIGLEMASICLGDISRVGGLDEKARSKRVSDCLTMAAGQARILLQYSVRAGGAK